jgi:microcystin-dependent protein
MGEQFLGEIRLFPIGFAPKGWAYCEGQTLSIANNSALYSLLGVTYGGNGTTTFNLPDLRGRVPIGINLDPGKGTVYLQGQSAGEAAHTLTVNEMPAHNHGVSASSNDKNLLNAPTNNVWAAVTSPYTTGTGAPVGMNREALASSGGSQPHNNMQPYLAMSFCIATTGIYPSRS